MSALPPPPSFDLSGKCALVVGAAGALGRACAVALADAGAAVTAADRDSDGLAALSDALGARAGACDTLEMDVTDTARTEALVAAHGPFDILLNAAGIARHGPALETTPEDYDAVMAVNLKGAYFLTRAVARGLIDAGRGGSLITISSQMGLVGGIDRAVYCATKHGVEGFTKAMAIEWGRHGIRVNTICPTFVLTELTRPTFADPERRAWIDRMIQLPRIARPEDIAGAAVYLASDAAAMVTGTALAVDGGWTAG